jgi:3alpha(or 20beta)-hydroxysteroid dehydrogenase
MPGRLNDKVVLVSGGARGMGAAEARLCTAEGARVVVGDVLEAEGQALASGLGDACAFVALDVTREDAWQNAIALTIERFGRLDGLVNNAGILRTGSIETTSLEEFETVMRVNQVGCFLGMKHAIPALRESGGGSIVNISSVAGMQGVAGVPAYVASKFAVRGLTKAAALEVGHDGIRVNSVHPGGVDTLMTGSDQLDRVDRDAVYASQPIPRIGQPEEIALLVVYLLSDESAYCTGSEFVIDGGSTAGQTHAGLGD